MLRLRRVKRRMARAELLGKRPAPLEKNTSDFRLEYGEKVPDQALINDVISYLGEYRFSLPKFSYGLKFSNGRLKDPCKGDSMRDIAQKALERRMIDKKSISREKAEAQGIVNLDSQLEFAKDNDTIVWASPPGPKEEGYGNYGFIFVGNIRSDSLTEKKINMTAVRIENPKIEQFNQAMYLFTGEKTNYKTAEEFIANPKVIGGNLNEDYTDALLGMSFSFKPNAKEQEKFDHIIQRMFPLISEFVHSAKNPWKSKQEKLKELYSLENYALELKREYGQSLTGRGNIIVDFKSALKLPDIVGEYGHEPPKVAGSCPSSSSSSLTSSNILSNKSLLNDLLGDQEWFHCPKCGYQADGPIGDTCPGCKLTKEEYAQETGVSCD